MRYAQIDAMGICFSVSELSGEVDRADMILIGKDADVQTGDIYDGSNWTRPPYVPPEPPEPTPEQIRIEQLERDNAQLRTELNQVKADAADTTMVLLELFEVIYSPE